jgi:hypothetical protein
VTRPKTHAALPFVLFGLFALFGSVVSGHGEGHDTAVIASVVDGGPAAAAGLKSGDRILRMGDLPLATEADLAAIVAAHDPGDRLPVVVERDGHRKTFDLTFGERLDGGISIGVSLELARLMGRSPHASPEQDGATGDGTSGCLDWIDDTYGIDALAESLDLDFASEMTGIRACVRRDTERMGDASALKYCDNVFKVHCSGLDLLTEIGEALSDRCAGDEIFDRYT